MEGRVCEMFSKNRKIFKSPKMPKIVPKIVQLCFEHVLGVLFSKNFFCPVFHGGSSLRNVFKKSKNFQNSKNAQIRSQKSPNVFWTCFEGIFFEIFSCPVFHGRSSLRNVFKKSKIFQKSKNAQNCSQIVETCFEHVLGYFFCKLFLPSVPWRVESSKCFQKIDKIFKSPKMPKIVPKSVQLCFEHVLGVLFSKIFFCPVFHGGSRLRNVFKKSKNFQNSKKAQNRSQKCPNVFWTCFWVNFS